MSLGSFLSGIALGGTAIYGGMTYHVLRTDDGLALVTKLQPSLSTIYLDVREFGISDWNRHRDVAAAIVANGKQEIFHEQAHETVTQGVGDFLREWGRLKQSP